MLKSVHVKPLTLVLPENIGPDAEALVPIDKLVAVVGFEICVTEVNTCVVSLFAFPAGPVCVAVTAKPFSSVPVIVKTIALVGADALECSCNITPIIKPCCRSC